MATIFWWIGFIIFVLGLMGWIACMIRWFIKKCTMDSFLPALICCLILNIGNLIIQCTKPFIR